MKYDECNGRNAYTRDIHYTELKREGERESERERQRFFYERWNVRSKCDDGEIKRARRVRTGGRKRNSGEKER